jgi:hypothetical protein
VHALNGEAGFDATYSKVGTVEARGAPNATGDEIAPSERTRLGRLGGLLVLIGSAAAAPASAFLDPAPGASEFLISVAGVATGATLMVVPWARLPERALYLIPIGATCYVVLGVSLYSDDFAFYQVLIAVYTAYIVRDRGTFVWLMVFFTAATLAPLLYVDESFDDLAHHILVTLPVMIISASVVRYLRDALTQRERQYRRFAVEAVTLAERIRGGPTPHNEATAENVEARLAELASETRLSVSRVKR